MSMLLSVVPTGRADSSETSVNSKVALVGSATPMVEGAAKTGFKLHYGDIIVLNSKYFGNNLSGRGSGDIADVRLMMNVADWEKWQVVDPADQNSTAAVKFNDKVLLKSVKWWNYLSARGSGDQADVKLMRGPDTWERWTIIDHANSSSNAEVDFNQTVLIKSDMKGNYLSGRGLGDEANVKLMNNPSTWEKWGITPIDTYYIRNWMSSTPELHTKHLRDITLPATHDSGTWSFPGEEIAPEGNFKVPYLDYNLDGVIGGAQTVIDKIFNAINIHLKIKNPVPVGPNYLVDYTIRPAGNLKNVLYNSVFDSIKDLSICQSVNIDQQLNAGIRWLDLRIYLKKDSGAYIHHFLKGVSMDEVLNSLQNFLATTKGEIVVVEMGHFVGDGSKSDFFQTVQNKLGAYVYKKELGNPFNQTYKDIVGDTPSSKVILLLDHEFDYANGTDDIFWTYDDLGMYTQNGDFKYANKTSADMMIDDQLNRFENIKVANKDSHPYTLWYTLTTNSSDSGEIIFNRMRDELPAKITDQLLSNVPGWIKDTASTVGFNIKSAIRNPVTEIVERLIPKYAIDYRSTKDLSNRVNPSLGNVLKSKFQSTSGNNNIQVIYADFFQNSALVQTAIDYSRDCIADNNLHGGSGQILSALTLRGSIPDLTVEQAGYELNNLSINGTNQYGDSFSLNGQIMQWTVTSGNSYATLTGSTLTPLAPGSGTVTATFNSVTSAPIKFTVIPAPVLQSATSDNSGTQILLTFNQAIGDPGNCAGAFSVIVSRNGTLLSESVTQMKLGSNDAQLILNLSKPLLAGDTVSVSYTPGNLTSAAGGIVDGFTNQAVTNQAPQPLSIGSGNPTVTVSSGHTNLAITPETLISAGNNPVNIDVPSGVEDVTLNVASLLQIPLSKTVTSTTMPAINITTAVYLNSTSTTSAGVQVQIPQGTTISAPEGWNGTIQMPTIHAANSVIIPTSGGNTTTIDSVIELGNGDFPLTFSHAVRILIPGQAGKKAGYVLNQTFFPINIFLPIDTVLSADDQSTADSTLADGQDGYINVGSDLVIWTKHFTQFVTYTETAIDSGGGNSNDGSSHDGGGSYTSPSTSTMVNGSGIITDAATGKVLSGVTVTLFYADTSRNRAAGKTMDTLVGLPGIDGFKPNNNQNPQASDASGAYGFMVFPDTDYYIVASKDGYNQYTSPTISVGQEIVHWDFKIGPTISGVTRLAGQSGVDTALAIAKAEFSGKVRNVILATADNYPDALAGSTLAYKLNSSILLIGSTDIDQEKVLDYMKENLDPAGTVYILGGTGAVSSVMESKVQASGFTHIMRIAGVDRYATSAKIAVQLAVQVGTPLVLVSGENYPDALSISSVAAQKQFPILLVQKDGLSDSVNQEIANIKPSKVYIIGGEGVISSSVENQVAQITGLEQGNIIRIGGADRYATSLEVLQYFNLGGQNISVATGDNYPDALAGSVYAANHNAPIILVDGILPDQVMNYLRTKKLTGAAIFGGEAVVSQEIEQQLQHLIGQ